MKIKYNCKISVGANCTLDNERQQVIS